jgi:hypothetical protein
LFATLVPATAVNGPNFSLSLSAPAIAVTAGGSSTITVSSAAVGGFNGQIALSCAAAGGLTCSFSPATISPGSSTASSTLTLAAAATAPGGGYGGYAALALLPGLALFGTLFTARGRKASQGKSILLMAGLALLVGGMTFTVACGSNSSTHQTTGNQANLTITGTSGAISHSIPVAVTVR